MYFSKPAITIFAALAATIPIFGVEGARTRKLKSSKSSKSDSGPAATLTQTIPMSLVAGAEIDATETSLPSMLGTRQIFQARKRDFATGASFSLETSCEVTGTDDTVQCTSSLCTTFPLLGGCGIYQYAGKRAIGSENLTEGIGVAVQTSGTGILYFGTDAFITIRFEDDQNLVVSVYNLQSGFSLEDNMELAATIPGFCPPEADPGLFGRTDCTDFTADEISDFLVGPARRALEPENDNDIDVFELVKKLHSK